MISGWWEWLRRVGPVALLAVLIMRLGPAPFLEAGRSLSLGVLLAAVGGTAVTTLCCAWRWRLVARLLGQPMGFGAAVHAYYRSQFLNVSLPGGMLGDVERGVRHGRQGGAVAGGLRSVAWERLIGQVVQVGLVLAVVAVLPSPLRSLAVVAAGVLGVMVVGLLGLALVARRRGAHLAGVLGDDVRRLLDARWAWVGLVLTSAVAASVHVCLFLVAATAVDGSVPVSRLVPLACVVLVAAAVPASIAGWGPREGAAVWAFGVAGLTAAQGLATSVVYGAMVFVATLPGAMVLLRVRRRSHPQPRSNSNTAAAGARGRSWGVHA